jgi:uncharacterized membrane-anchored protein
MAHVGGRKFALSVLGLVAVFVLAWFGKDSVAYGSIAVIVGGFVGGNSYVSGKHAEASRGA